MAAVGATRLEDAGGATNIESEENDYRHYGEKYAASPDGSSQHPSDPVLP